MLNTIKTLCILMLVLFWKITGVFVYAPIIALLVIFFYEADGFQYVKDCYEWIIRLLARPVVNHYEAREKNYKDLIFKLESQLYQKRVELGEADKTHPSGSCWGLSQELNEFLAEETKQ